MQVRNPICQVVNCTAFWDTSEQPSFQCDEGEIYIYRKSCAVVVVASTVVAERENAYQIRSPAGGGEPRTFKRCRGCCRYLRGIFPIESHYTASASTTTTVLQTRTTNHRHHFTSLPFFTRSAQTSSAQPFLPHHNHTCNTQGIGGLSSLTVPAVPQGGGSHRSLIFLLIEHAIHSPTPNSTRLGVRDT